MTRLLPLLIVLAVAAPAAAQDGTAPAPAQPPVAAQGEAEAPEPAAPEAEGTEADEADEAGQTAVAGFIYNPEGRRDPFVSLVQRGAEATVAEGTVLEGVGALTVDEVALRGVLDTPQGFVALIEGADTRTYIVRSGDRLRDGTVELIGDEDMVIRQQVNDPLSLETEREVRKTLRQTQEAAP